MIFLMIFPIVKFVFHAQTLGNFRPIIDKMEQEMDAQWVTEAYRKRVGDAQLEAYRKSFCYHVRSLTKAVKKK